MVLPRVLELVVRNAGVAYGNTTLTPPPVLSFDSLFSFEVFNFLSLKMRFDKVTSEINCGRAISSAFGHHFQVNIRNQIDLTA